MYSKVIQLYIYFLQIIFHYRLLHWILFPVLFSKSSLLIYFMYSRLYLLISYSFYFPPSLPVLSPVVTLSSFSVLSLFCI